MPFHTNQKKIISDALLQLLEEKTITKITIPEICSKADISKATFYNYFSDKYSVLAYITASIFDSNVESNTITDKTDFFFEHILEVLKTIYRYRRSMKNVFIYGKQNSIYQFLFQRTFDHLKLYT